LEYMDDDYLKESQPAAIVRDYLASMTDANFLRQCQELFFPQPLPLKFA
jgi:dGTP triphosphohydrolase